MKTPTSNRKTVLPVLMLAIIVIGLSVPVARGFRAIRHEAQVRSVLLEIQRSLQDWHVAEEIYPRQTPMTGAELVGLLMESGHLEKSPHNPWTGRPFTPGQETAKTDRIRYSTDELAETYALKAMNRKDDGIFFQLDSTEHHSLE